MKKFDIIAGIDVGYGMSKGSVQMPNGEMKIVSMPSLVGGVGRVGYDPNLENLKKFEVSFDSGSYEESFYVGPLVETQSSYVIETQYRKWTESAAFKALFLATLASVVRAYFEDGEDSQRTSFEDLNLFIVTGLPVKYYDLDQKTLISNFSGIQEFYMGSDDVDGVVKTKFRVNLTIMAIPQPVGTYYNVSIDEHGKLRDPRLSTAKIAILDIGNNTTDLATMSGQEYMGWTSASIEHGGSKVVDSIVQELNAKYGYEIEKNDLTLAQTILEERKCIISGKEFDVSEIIDRAIRSVGNKILSFAKERLGEGTKYASIILTGGGSNFFKELIKETYPHATTAPGSNPQFSNVVGYLKMARDARTKVEAQFSKNFVSKQPDAIKEHAEAVVSKTASPKAVASRPRDVFVDDSKFSILPASIEAAAEVASSHSEETGAQI